MCVSNLSPSTSYNTIGPSDAWLSDKAPTAFNGYEDLDATGSADFATNGADLAGHFGPTI